MIKIESRKREKRNQNKKNKRELICMLMIRSKCGVLESKMHVDRTSENIKHVLI